MVVVCLRMSCIPLLLELQPRRLLHSVEFLRRPRVRMSARERGAER